MDRDGGARDGSAVLVNVAGGRGSLIGGVNEVFPALAKVYRGLGGQGLAVARVDAVFILDTLEPISGGATRGLLLVAIFATLSDGLLARATWAHGALQGRQGRGATGW